MRTLGAALGLLVVAFALWFTGTQLPDTTTPAPEPTKTVPALDLGPIEAPTPLGAQAGSLSVLAGLSEPTNPRSAYRRVRFGAGWSDLDADGCRTRDEILSRDLDGVRKRADGCVVLSGTLADPYTGERVRFTRGGASEVDIDHVVSLGDAWRAGASRWTDDQRERFANDPMNLYASDAGENRSKGDATAAEYLPPNPAFRCAYVERQVWIKHAYALSVEPDERIMLKSVLRNC